MAINQALSKDLAARSLRPLTDTELEWGTVRLRDAFTQILAALPAAGPRLDAGTVQDTLNQLVVQVQCAMVLRVLTNPDGVLEETVDDYTRRLDAAISTGALYVTDQERALLASSVGVSQGAFTIRPAGCPDPVPSWFPTSWGAW